jgi:SPP1 gp7 family putative phage head morphogenesis protein
VSVTTRTPPTFPKATERRMAAIGLRYVRAFRKLIEPRLLAELRAARADVDDPDKVFRVALVSMLGYLSVTETEIPPGTVVTAGMFNRYGVLVQRQAEAETARILGREAARSAPRGQAAEARRRVVTVLQTPSLTAVDPARREPAGTTPWAEEAASRIKVIAEDYRDRVRAIIEEGYEMGRATEAIARDIERIGAASENRARLWARDQIGTINSVATEAAHQRAGVTHYRWWTSQDERVRDEDRPGGNHRKRHGIIFAWARPPAEDPYDGHPGRPINDRCVAIPIPPEELDAALAEQAARGDLPPFAAT